MTDERRPQLPTHERRREVTHSDEVRGRGIVAPTVNPAAPVTRAELDEFKRLVLSEVDDKLESYAGGLDARVRDVVRGQVESALAPFKPGLAKLDQIAKDAEEIRKAAEETTKYRAERDMRERLEKEASEKREAEQKLKLAEATLSKTLAEAAAIPADVRGRRLAPILAVFGTVIVALLALLGGMIKSRM